MPESLNRRDHHDVYREEAREFKLSESTLKILDNANPIFWNLAAKAKFHPLVFMSLYSTIEESLKSQAVFDAMFDFLSKRYEVTHREQIIENSRLRLIDPLHPLLRIPDSESSDAEAVDYKKLN